MKLSPAAVDQAAQMLASMPALRVAVRELAARGVEAVDQGAVPAGGADGELRGTSAKQSQVTCAPRVGNRTGTGVPARSTRGRAVSHGQEP